MKKDFGKDIGKNFGRNLGKNRGMYRGNKQRNSFTKKLHFVLKKFVPLQKL